MWMFKTELLYCQHVVCSLESPDLCVKGHGFTHSLFLRLKHLISFGGLCLVEKKKKHIGVLQKGTDNLFAFFPRASNREWPFKAELYNKNMHCALLDFIAEWLERRRDEWELAGSLTAARFSLLENILRVTFTGCKPKLKHGDSANQNLRN